MRSLRYLLPCTLALLSTTTVPAQGDPRIPVKEALQALAAATNDAQRDSINTELKKCMRAMLDIDESFGRNYDSLPMSRVDAPDQRFRLFTWNVPRDDGSHLFEGFLLVNEPKVQTLFELRDMSHAIPSPEVPELGAEKWYGALYYDVIPVKKGGTTYYTLLGWKGHSRVETRKVIEVMHFKGGKPRFGAPIFGSSGRVRPMRRVFGYSFQASMMLRYEPSLKAIVFDHLSPSRPEMVGQPAYYGPDMVQDAYFWYKGRWFLQPDVDLRDPKRPR